MYNTSTLIVQVYRTLRGGAVPAARDFGVVYIRARETDHVSQCCLYSSGSSTVKRANDAEDQLSIPASPLRQERRQEFEKACAYPVARTLSTTVTE